MTDPDSATIKKTQNSLGKYVKKPALTDKLLKKPPFRFLHDVINVVIKDTNFLKGLYSPEELVSENIKDRDAKVAYLQKLIDVTKSVTGKDLKVRPSKIVAGLEPDKTNELLQAIGYALDKKLDSTEAVQNYNGGATSSNGTASEKPKAAEVPAVAATPAAVVNGVKAKEEKKDDKRSKEKAKEKTKEKERVKDGKEKEKERSKEKTKRSGEDVVNGKSKDKAEKVSKSKDKERTSSKTEGKPSSKVDGKVEKSEKRKLEKSRSKDKEKPLKRSESIKEESTEGKPQLNQDSSVDNDSKDSLKENQEVLEVNGKKSIVIQQQDDELVAVIDEEAELRRMERNNSRSERISAKPPIHRQQSVDSVMRPRTSLRPPSVRPPSARPGAPRRKEKNVEIVLQPNETTKLGEINVKMEVFNNELLDDDGENLIVIEDPTQVDNLYGGGSEGQEVKEEQDQGHLVQQILETQKEFSNIAGAEAEVVKKEWTSNQRQSSAKQMETMRESIQKLTRSVNPLGKLMDFLQEDIDSMERELTNWQQVYSKAAQELAKERSANENAVEPLKHQLAQIETSIREYHEMIDITRANILQNEQKIERLYMTEI
ncbi:conserved hypothetical protein [Culex quinquefasciatus]|uniref:TRAF3-interacting protein 1 n=1 Tax=Culex quinquefasciatus TaxID=7176 RepID=B0WJG0_CULQU|nr:conserved hypothetical protein [Culex quinquefasciatus]|eukprot:XP_001848844.1 conserved hypothetical protein [Culex quinquefasciatus]